MRELSVKIITQTISDLIMKAQHKLPIDIKEALLKAIDSESNLVAKDILRIILENADIAEKNVYPLCQDTGMAFIYIEVGQDIHFINGSLKDAIYSGVELSYEKGFLRKSIVADPIRRINTGNNLPPVIFTEIVNGNKIKITVVPKGFGAENQSAIKMFTPSATKDEIIDFIVNGVIESGSRGCPPGIIGVGIGGSFDYSANLSKKALLNPINKPHQDPFYAEMELEIMNIINKSNIGPMGVGGNTTVLGVNIIEYPTHIAGLPVAYNYCCHSLRHSSTII